MPAVLINNGGKNHPRFSTNIPIKTKAIPQPSIAIRPYLTPLTIFSGFNFIKPCSLKDAKIVPKIAKLMPAACKEVSFSFKKIRLKITVIAA